MIEIERRVGAIIKLPTLVVWLVMRVLSPQVQALKIAERQSK
jgi:hypothetical protein